MKSSELRLGEYVFDSDEIRLTQSDGQPVSLRHKSLEVLKILAENSCQTVLREDLLSVVWGDNHVSEDSLAKCIADIRKAIDDHDKRLIQTIPRKGYKLVDRPESHPVRHRLKYAAIVVLVLVVGAAALLSDKVWVSDSDRPDNLAFPLPDKPSIAVLPFENLSDDTKQDFLGDGITENITTALSRVAGMFVIPRTTTRTYKGKPVKLVQVAEELGVRYVLEGSVQRSGDQVRVTATLVDVLKGHQIWTERYNREVKDTFALQDDITLNVLTELEVKFTRGENARAMRGNTQSLEAYQLLARGLRLFRRFTKDGNAEARQLFEEAIESDPEYALAWYLLGWTHQTLAIRGWAADPAQASALALELSHKALALDPSGGAPYMLLADISAREGRYDDAITFSERAVALLPSNAIAAAALGRILILTGRPEEALAQMQSVKRFNPTTPPNLSRTEGLAYHSLGRYDEAITALEHARAHNPKGVTPLAFLAMTYADMGRMEEARAMVQKVLELSPGFKVNGFVNYLIFKDRTKTERARSTLLALGLP